MLPAVLAGGCMMMLLLNLHVHSFRVPGGSRLGAGEESGSEGNVNKEGNQYRGLQVWEQPKSNLNQHEPLKDPKEAEPDFAGENNTREERRKSLEDTRKSLDAFDGFLTLLELSHPECILNERTTKYGRVKFKLQLRSILLSDCNYLRIDSDHDV
jgi:hypothetical protein